jgi:hypothetical protein
MNNNFQYIDGIGNIQIAEGVVRLDVLMMTRIEGDKSTAEKVGGLAMSMPAFLRSFNQMNLVVNKMLEQGMLKRNDGEVTPQQAATAASDQ